MTAKDQAIKLIREFKEISSHLGVSVKWCAIVCCASIIEESSLTKTNNPFTEYWSEVINEIVKL